MLLKRNDIEMESVKMEADAIKYNAICWIQGKNYIKILVPILTIIIYKQTYSNHDANKTIAGLYVSKWRTVG